jgi:hypothetical protein
LGAVSLRFFPSFPISTAPVRKNNLRSQFEGGISNEKRDEVDRSKLCFGFVVHVSVPGNS